MRYPDYAEQMKDVAPPRGLEFKLAVLWLHPDRLPVGLVGLGDCDAAVVRVPAQIQKASGTVAPVIAVARSAFAGNEHITDVLLPASIEALPAGLFAGCTNLQNVTIPRRVKRVGENTFAGCVHLKNIYYEGSLEEWKRVEIVHEAHEIEFGSLVPGTPVQSVTAERMVHIPGNEPLFAADIHFGCALAQTDAPRLTLRIGGSDVTGLFRLM